jgi:hypothetical protein
MILAALLLAASPARVVLADELVRVPPAQSRAIPILLKQQGAVLECRWAVLRGGSGVRLSLLSAAEALRLEAGQRHRPLASTPYRKTGSFRQPVTAPGEYRLVIDNRLEGRGPALVHVELSAVFGDPLLQVRELDAGRRATVVLVSLTLFLAVAGWAGWRILRALGRQHSGDD